MPSIPRTFTLLLALTILDGCGPGAKQLASARSFGASTVSVSTLAASELAGARSDIVSMQARILALDTTVKPHRWSIDDPVSFEAVTIRTRACQALELYGKLLAQLAAENRSDSLELVASAFLSDAQAALGSSMDPEIAKATTSALSGVGSAITEARRLRALRQIVSSWRAPVDSMASLLEADFSLKPGSTGILSASVTTATVLRSCAIDILSSPGRNTLERDLAARSLETALRSQERSRELSRQACDLLAGLRSANAELQSSLSSRRPSMDAITALASRARTLVDLQQALTR